MPAASADLTSRPTSPEPLPRLPFPPVTTSHILHCSYHFWHPLYRAHTPKARLLPLPPAFLAYLRRDGIVLPPSPHSTSTDSETSSWASDSDSDHHDPSHAWPELHASIRATIAELGGSIVPKLNWSAPKDATWMIAGNSMECRAPGDVYLLLKSSDFITHDLDLAFDGCVDDSPPSGPSASGAGPAQAVVPYTLVLRKTVASFNPACEFRCFVRERQLLCLCQRDLNHYEFLGAMVPMLRARIQGFFDEVLRDTFPDACFVFDVYVPPPHRRVWLVDVNPWAPRTDPLLFGWLEVLGMEGREGTTAGGGDEVGMGEEDVEAERSDGGESREEEDDDDEEEEVPFRPEVRLVKKDDPEAYSFASPQFSAHKLPKDVVDASRGGFEGEGGLREFMGRWRDIVARQDADEEEDHEDG